MTSIKITLVTLLLLLFGSFYVNQAIDTMQMEYLEMEDVLQMDTLGYQLAGTLLEVQTEDELQAQIDKILQFTPSFTLWDMVNHTHLSSQTGVFEDNATREQDRLLASYVQVNHMPVSVTIDEVVHIYIPLYDADGQVCAVFETQHIYVADGIFGFLPEVTGYTIVSMTLLCLVPTALALWYLHRVRKIDLAMRRHGQFKAYGLGISSISKLEDVFAVLCKYIARYHQNIAQIRQFYAPFVPQDIISALDKPDITALAVGQKKEQNTLVLRVRSTNYAEIVKETSPSEVFSYVNTLFNLMLTHIGEGQLVRFDQADSTILLTGTRAQALAIAGNLARDMTALRQRFDGRLVEYSFAAVEMTVRLGIVGCEARSEMLVHLGENTLCDELHALAKGNQMGVLFVCDQPQMQENARLVAKSSDGRCIYEDFSAKSSEQVQLRTLTKTVFEQSVVQFYNGELARANAGFIEVIRKNNDDFMAYHYFEICNNEEENLQK